MGVMKIARSAYQTFGPTASSLDDLKTDVVGYMATQMPGVGVAASTDYYGNSSIPPYQEGQDPYVWAALWVHEETHVEQVHEAAQRLGGIGSDEYNEWFTSPQVQAANEVGAYTAGIDYLQSQIDWMQTIP
jgi:hypothetical protein